MLNVKVSRNEPCPCGSGKKYKKCCGLQKTVSITSIIGKEVMDLQTQLIQYAMHEYDVEIDRDFEKRLEELMTEDEEEMEYYLFVHTIWFALFQPVAGGKTILQRFIDERSRMVQRPKVKEILQSWTTPRPIAGRILRVESNRMAVRDVLTEETLEIKLLEQIESTDGSFAFGFVVPFENEFILFPTVFDLEGDGDAREEQFLQEEYALSGYEDPIEFLVDDFLSLMNELPFATIGYSPEDFEWQSEKHKHVALLFENKMLKMGAPSTAIATGIILWYKYCENDPKMMKKPETYAAASHYLNLTVNPLIDVTKKEVALEYGISPSTLGTAITEMEMDMHEILRDLKSLHLEQILEAMESEGIGFPEDFEDELDESDYEELPNDIDDEDLPF